MSARFPRITLAARAPYLRIMPDPKDCPSPEVSFHLDLLAEQAAPYAGSHRDYMRAIVYKLAGYAPPP